MKLKSILSICLATVTVATCSSAVFAADSNAIKFGEPISATTGEKVTDTLVAGDVVAIPVDVTTTTGNMTSFSVRLEMSDSLSAGASLTSAQRTTLQGLGDGTAVYSSTATGSRKYYFVKNVFTEDAGEKFPAEGTTWGCNPAETVDSKEYFKITFAGVSSAYSSEPEVYAVCTVEKDIDVDTLNKELVLADANSELSDTSIGLVNKLTADTAKFNATQGAFKVVLDSAALPNGNWVQGLYAQVGDAKQDITACVHADGTTTYEFPVRVNSATGATDSITADIYANVTADEAGNTAVSAKKVGSVTLTMDGTVTSYNVVNGTVAE